MKRRRNRYIFNLRTRTLHRLPSTERCNVDQMKRRGNAIWKFSDDETADVLGNVTRCAHCWPRWPRHRG